MVSLHDLTVQQWSYIIRYILASISLDYVFLRDGKKKKIYRNRGNTWENGPGKQCNGYLECETSSDRFKTKSKIHYQLKEQQLSGDDQKDEAKSVEIQYNDPIFKYLSEFGGLGCEIACNKPIIFKHSFEEPNDDHRGSDHTKLILDFNPTYAITPTFLDFEKEEGIITLDQIADAIFRVKSHKFDLCYEMLFGASKVIETPSAIVVHLNFDYGS